MSAMADKFRPPVQAGFVVAQVIWNVSSSQRLYFFILS